MGSSQLDRHFFGSVLRERIQKNPNLSNPSLACPEVNLFHAYKIPKNLSLPALNRLDRKKISP